MKESEIRDCLADVIEKLDAVRPRSKTLGAVGGSLIAAIAIGFGGCRPDAPPNLPYGIPEPPDAGAEGDATAAPTPTADPSASPTAAPTTSAAAPPPPPVDPGVYTEYMAPDP